jgi:hypothetical protein
MISVKLGGPSKKPARRDPSFFMLIHILFRYPRDGIEAACYPCFFSCLTAQRAPGRAVLQYGRYDMGGGT